MIGTLVVLAKRPVPGRVKTRLTPPLTPAQAAEVAAASLRDTIAAVDAAPARHRLLSFDGAAEEWVPDGWLLTPQPRGGLDVRVAAAFAAAPAGPAFLVGMDTPQLAVPDLTFDTERYDACLGPAVDGGYWAIGFADPALAGRAVIGVPMSTAQTGAAQRHRLESLGLRVQLLRPMVDVDDIHDAHTVAAQAPQSSFATALARTNARRAG